MNLKGLFGIFFLLKIVNLLRKYEVLSFDSENSRSTIYRNKTSYDDPQNTNLPLVVCTKVANINLISLPTSKINVRPC